jgi:hypothetical protein
VSLGHLVCYHVAIDVHRRSDVCVPHQLPLNGNGCSHGIEPASVGVAHTMRPDLADSSRNACLAELPQHLVVAPRLSAQLQRGSEYPVVWSRELRRLLPYTNQRINRKLRADGEVLKRARGNVETTLGEFYVVNVERNFVAQHHVNLAELGRELEVMAEWESLQ